MDDVAIDEEIGGISIAVNQDGTDRRAKVPDIEEG